jgi:hypothetical protein
MFARLKRADDRVRGSVKVFGGVRIGRRVAAADVSAG